MVFPTSASVIINRPLCSLSREYTRGRGKLRGSTATSVRRASYWRMFFSFCAAQYVPSILRMRRGIPQACLTLIYQQPMAWIAAAFEACGSVHSAMYTSWGEAAVQRPGLPLLQVYSQLYRWLKSRFYWYSSSLFAILFLLLHKFILRISFVL